MKYHTIHTMRVDDCQEMIMTGDYMKICRSKTINPIVKRKARRKHDEFIEQLQELFSGEDIGKMVDLHTLIQKMRIDIYRLINLHEGLKNIYTLKTNPKRLKILETHKKTYRELLGTYPNSVDDNGSADKQRKQIDSALNPIKNKINFLKYKIKEIEPKKQVSEEKQEQKGLELHIQLVQAMNPEIGYFDRSMKVDAFKQMYDSAVSKNLKLKAQQNG